MTVIIILVLLFYWIVTGLATFGLSFDAKKHDNDQEVFDFVFSMLLGGFVIPGMLLQQLVKRGQPK